MIFRMIPTDEKLKEILASLLKSADLENVTPRQLRSEIETKLQMNPGTLDDKKQEIKKWINEFMATSDDQAELRKIASQVKVPPNFWKNAHPLREALIEFCFNKGVVSEKRLPSKEEIKKYKDKRSLEAELEGLNTKNILPSKRPRNYSLSPWFCSNAHGISLRVSSSRNRSPFYRDSNIERKNRKSLFGRTREEAAYA